MRLACRLIQKCLLLAAVVVLPLAAKAQTVKLLTVDQSTWSYQTNKVDPAYVPADAWTAPGFNDSAWPTGKGLFGTESGIAAYAPWIIQTPIVPPQAGAGVISSYFRTRFNWSGSADNVVLQFTNYMDDGILVFLNGVELFSFNVPADRPLPWNTLALPNGANPLGEGVPFITSVIPANLVVGENVIAVVLHQQGNGTSDDVFGMALNGVRPVAPVDLTPNQPTNRTLLQFRSSVLTVSASGSPAPSYQWYEDGNAIAGANSASLTITNESPDTVTKNYYCNVANGLGSFDSRVAAVLFTSDSVAPRVIGVSQAGPFNLVTVTFDEVVEFDSAVNQFTYGAIDGANNRIDPVTVTLNPNGSSVTVDYGVELLPGTLYTMNVVDVRDLAGNPMVAEVLFPFTTWVPSECGGVLFETFDTSAASGGIDGSVITMLTGNANYPNNPRETYRLNSFSSRGAYTDDSHEQYGGRMRALFIPPSSGNWVFYLSSDDAGQLFLNPTGPGEGGKIMIQQETGCCGAYSAHASAPYALEGGKAYYLEAIYKEGGGGDYCHVWAGPQGTPPPSAAAASLTPADAIPGSMLGSPAAPANVAGSFTITTQPADRTAVPNATATFSVGTSSDALKCYQWFRDGVAIPNAVNSQYRLVVQNSDNGAVFSVVVSIIGGNTATSGNATLTVGADTIRPTVLSVAANAAGTQITVTYSEAMDPTSSASAANYTVAGAAPASVTLNGSGTVATLVLASPLASGGCTLSEVRISGVKDTATVGNLINPNPTTVSLSSPFIEILALGATWKYNDSLTDLGTSWSATAFNDTAWLSGPAPLGFEPAVAQVPVVATPIGEGTKTNTAYFRTHFTLGVNPATIAVLQLSGVVDDGAVFYLNGVEAGRLRMPAAPAVITAATLATAGSPEPVDGTHTVESISISKAALVAGDNVLAVELHPSSITSSDSEFGVSIRIVICVPTLVVQHVGSQVKLTWGDAAYRLETAPTVDGPWAAQAGASGVSVPASPNNAFFRLVNP